MTSSNRWWAKRYTLGVDFDGVLHEYSTPWVSPEIIPDPLIPGAIEWLNKMSKKFDILIFTTRGCTEAGRSAINLWLRSYGYSFPNPTGFMDVNGVLYLGTPSMTSSGTTTVPPIEPPVMMITDRKLPALIYIDDRGWRFTGTFPTHEEISKSYPWQQGQSEIEEDA